MLEERGIPRLSSNDLLGVEYIKAAKKQGVKLEFYTIKRMGSGYREETLNISQFPSATAIRCAWNEGKDAFEGYMPKEAAEIYQRAFLEGNITDEKQLESVVCCVIPGLAGMKISCSTQ